MHTGSHGIGPLILANAGRSGSNPPLSPDSPLLASFLSEHDYAVKWAVANRDLVAHRIQCCLFSPLDDGTPQVAPLSTDLQKIVDVTHNSVSPSTMEIGGEMKQVWIHRKGVAPADKGVVPCPGSRGDFSWLLEPCGTGNENGE